MGSGAPEVSTIVNFGKFQNELHSLPWREQDFLAGARLSGT